MQIDHETGHADEFLPMTLDAPTAVQAVSQTNVYAHAPGRAPLRSARVSPAVCAINVSAGASSTARDTVAAMLRPHDAISPAVSAAAGHLLGYARVSTAEQDPALQLDALQAAGCARVWVEHASGARTQRPRLQEVLEHLLPGDTLVVWRLDRLGRSIADLIAIAEALKARDVGLRSLQESIDTTSPGGQLIFHIFGALAEFERELIRERTRAGLDAARARGRRGGRRSVMTPAKIAAARQMYDSREHTVEAIARALGVSRATIYRALGRRPAQSAAPGTVLADDGSRRTF